jgi:predicted dehydrogenase
MKKIQTAVIGTGFMGKVHAENLRRLGNVEIVAVAGSSDERARQFANNIGVNRATGNYEELLEDPSIAAVHILTPNALHYRMCRAALLAGKHVLCEKPFTVSAAEARDLTALAAQTRLGNCIQHNLRYYPVVQQIRRMIEAGDLGEVLIVQGTYSQDWLLYDTDWNWRVDAEANGALRAMGDIGSHWMDMIQHLTGLRITSLCADLATFHKTRRKPKGRVETFAGKTLAPGAYDVVPIRTEDFGSVLLRLGDRARGAFTVSQMSAGRKNMLTVDIYGTKAGVSESGAPRQAVDRPAQQSQPGVGQGSGADVSPGGRVRRPARRAQRRLRRHPQAAFPAFLRAGGGPVGARRLPDV